MSGEDLQDFYDNIDFEIVESFDKPSPSGTIKLKHVFPITAEALSKSVKDDAVDLIEQIGSGGQKLVFKGLLHSDQRHLALAFMKEVSDLDEVENFFREARISMSLRHPSIVRTFDFGLDEDYGPYTVMEWVDGQNLHHILRAQRSGMQEYNSTFTMDRLIGYFLDVCKAVSFAHSKDIIHLDLKPENILVNFASDKALLTDWGLAKAFSPLENFDLDPLLLNCDTKAGYFRGTPGYMSPEQITEQKKNEKTDIYQLGALLYALVFKHCPVEGDNVDEILKKTLKGEIFVDNITDENLPLIAICKKAMSTEQEDRYSDVREMINEINKIEFVVDKKKSLVQYLVLAALIPVIIVVSAFSFIDSENTEMRKLEIQEVEVFEPAKPHVSGETFLMPEDISLLSEFEDFGRETVETPLYFSNEPVPAWYGYLNDLLNRELGEIDFFEVDLYLKKRLISYNTSEDGL